MSLRRVALSSLFFFSGATGLVYQVLWTRQLGRLAGNGNFALAAVLSAFMAGLAIGARLFSARSDRARHPARIYGLLELGIGLYAFALPGILDAVTCAYVALFRAAEGHLLFLTSCRFALSFLVLGVPTVFMGGTFPMLLRATGVQRDRVGRRAGWLYAANTAGAVLGVACGGFLLIRLLGLEDALRAAGAVNIALGLLAITLLRERTSAAPASSGATPDLAVRRLLSDIGRWDRAAIASVAFLGGLAALGAEVIWTRLLAVSFSSVTYSFSVMLSVFLLCLSVGAWVVGAFADRLRRPATWLAGLHFAIAVSLVASLAATHDFGRDIGTQPVAFGTDGWREYLFRLSLHALRVMGAPALLMGAAMPLLLRAAAARGRGVGEEVGRAYSANTWGAAVGPLLLALVVIPRLGDLCRALLTVSLASVAAAAVAASLGRKWVLSAATLVAGVLSVGVAWRQAGGDAPPEQRLPWLRYLAAHGAGVLYHEEGPTVTTTVVESADGEGRRTRALYTDSFEVAGTVADYQYMRMIGHLPALLCADPHGKALVVGFGTGTTAGALSVHPFERIDLVDISPEVFRTARFFAEANGGVAEGSPRVREVVEDGRLFLRASREEYQVIVAEPPLPYLAGSVNLYSRDFYQACAWRLAPGGLVCQWMPHQFVRGEDYRAMLRAFLEVFPDATLWYFRNSFIALGGRGTVRADLVQMTERMASGFEVRGAFARADVVTPAEVLAGFLMDAAAIREFVGDARAVTDDNASLEFFTPGGRLRDSAVFLGREILARRVPLTHLASSSDLSRFGVSWKAEGRLLAANLSLLEGDVAGAEEAMQVALVIDPDCRAARRQLAELDPTAPMLARHPVTREAPRIAPISEVRVRPASDDLDELRKRMSSQDARVRRAAIQAAGERKDARLLADLAALLSHEDWQTRARAVEAIAAVPSAEVRGLLVRALSDDDPFVRKAAYRSLRATGAPDLPFDPEADDSVRAQQLLRWQEWAKQGDGR